MSTKVSQRNKRRSNRKSNKSNCELGPPQLTIAVKVTHSFRFQATAAITFRSLTFTELLDLWCMAISATAAYRLVGAVKLKRLRIWAAAGNSTSPMTVSFQKQTVTAGISSDAITYSDTVLGVSRNAFLEVKFSDKEQVGQWQNNATGGGYGNITVPQGGIVDLQLAMSMLESSSGITAVSGAVTGATIGAVYCRYLDNSQATPQLQPVTYVSI